MTDLKLFKIILILLLLQGCGMPIPDRKFTNLITALQAKVAVPIEPLPMLDLTDIQKSFYKTGSLSATLVKNPFAINLSLRQQKGFQSIRPDANRPRGPLEFEPLDHFKMIGFFEQEDHFSALVQNEAGRVYLVKIGDYLGQNSGQIQRITDNQMILKELVVDGLGGWKERFSSLRLEFKESKDPTQNANE